MGNCLASQDSSVIASFTNKFNTRAKVKGTKTPKNGPTRVGEIVIPTLKIYTYQQLMMATNNFKTNTIIGEGGFGRVYKGWIDEFTFLPSKPSVGIPIAIKRCKANSVQAISEWKTEIEMLAKFSHPNLVKLIGCCWQERELLLVYEYMQKGSLERHIFQENREAISWETRIKIAIDSARGLDFLHTNENVVIFRDFKPANILLDEMYNAKLSDFGIAKLGPTADKSHVTTRRMGTHGYVAPEYMESSHLYVKSDVYSFGVVLLELVTGLRAYDSTRPTGQTDLVEWHKPMLSDMSNLRRIVDPRMKEYPPKGLSQMGQLILKCVQQYHNSRPHMCEVLLELEKISKFKIVSKGSRASSSQSRSIGQYNRPNRQNPCHIHHHGTERPGNQVVQVGARPR